MTVNNPISPFISTQFPEFYLDEGENFIAFLEAYYEFLETDGQILNSSRNFLNWRDVDGTIDQFISHFKNEFLANIPTNTVVDQKFLIKHIQDIYKSKGTPRCLKLLFRLFFNEEIDIYYPKTDLLKPSDGQWIVPVYLELSHSNRTADFEGNYITGSISHAKAFVDRVSRKRVNAKIIDVCYLSDITGEFQYGEQVCQDGNYSTAPYVTGSVTDISITAGGLNQSIGTVLNVISDNGVDGVVRVTETTNGKGQVTFTLEDGGSGYTIGAPTQVYISNNVLAVNNLSAHVALMDTLYQPLNDVSYMAISGRYANGAPIPGVWSSNTALLNTGFPVGQTVFGYDSANNLIANGVILTNTNTGTGTGTFKINVTSNSFANAHSLVLSNNDGSAQVSGFVNTSISSLIIGSNTGYIGVCEVTGSFFPNTYVYTANGQTATLTNVFGGSGANFQVAALADSENLKLYSDTVGANNAASIPFLDIYLSGNNSHEANNGYGFVKAPLGGIDTPLEFLFTSNNYNVGTIASLNKIAPGTDYTKDPFILVYNPVTAGFNAHDYFYTITQQYGSFIAGEEIISSYIQPTQLIIINNVNGAGFTLDEGVYQVGSRNTVTGQVIEVSNNSILVQAIAGSFSNVTTAQVCGLFSNTVANVAQTISVSNNVLTQTAVVMQANTSGIWARQAVPLGTGSKIVGNVSRASGTIGGEAMVANSTLMGENAIIDPYVLSGNGIVKSVAIISSGFGYLQNEDVTMTDETGEVFLSGTISLNNQGVGEGFYNSTGGFLSSDKKLHDNQYYQEYSYEVQCGISLDRYATLLKNAFHVAGTAMFGRVVKNAALPGNSAPAETNLSIGKINYNSIHAGDLSSTNQFGNFNSLNTNYHIVWVPGITPHGGVGTLTQHNRIKEPMTGIASSTTFGTLTRK